MTTPTATPVPIHLIVTQPFGDRQAGDRITDPDEVAGIQAGPHAGCVVPVAQQPKAKAQADAKA